MNRSTTTKFLCLVAFAALASTCLVKAVLVQPYNYMLDDSSLLDQQAQQDAGSLSPYLNDPSAEHIADKDIISIIGDGLARLRYARMLDHTGSASSVDSGLSQEMAELLQNERNSKQDMDQMSAPGLLMNVAQAAAQAFAGSTNSDDAPQADVSQSGPNSGDMSPSSRGSIMELETSPSSSSASLPSKSDLKVGPTQWFNPKEVIPVLKISSMATPSKYKKVYFRSEKKLVDGAFHSPSSEPNEKKSFIKPFNSGVQRRSSRGTASSAPPGVFQDGFVDFIKKFRDVYVQTRPAGGSSSSPSSSSSLASNMLSAASPFVAALGAPGSRPNLASALSAASSMISGGQSSPLSASGSSASSSSLLASGSAPDATSALSSSLGNAASSALGAAASAAAGSATSTGAASPSKTPLSAQSYVSFWSKTFPTWVRKMLKQLRRRSLQNSSKRQKQHNHHSSNAAKLGQAAQAAANVAAVVGGAQSSTGDSSSSSSSSSH